MSLLSKRIPTILGVLVLVAGIVGGVMIVNQQKVPIEEGQYQPSKIKITNVADNKFTVSWVTSEPASGKVFYGKVGESLSNEIVDDRDALSSEAEAYITHHVTIKDLQPETQYAFRLISGTDKEEYDNDGSPYVVTTGPELVNTPPADTVYGIITQPSTLPAEGAIVYVEVPGGVPLSTLVKSSGNWTIPMSTARSSDLSAYVSYDDEATSFTITAESGKQQATATTRTAYAAPVPTMVIGESYDFREGISVPSDPDSVIVEDIKSGGIGDVPIAGELPAEEPPLEDLSSEEPQVAEIFNIESLGDVATVSAEIIILNPEEDGEVLTTVLPEFRGTGSEGATFTITVESVHTHTDSVTVDNDGTWTWSPPEDLEAGEHTVTIAYLDTSGIERILRRSFVVQANDSLPAFESTPSASISPSATPESASASPRVSIPSTESGVPVSGVVGPTLFVIILGILATVAGALLWVL